MGMYDEIEVRCPACGTIDVLQSKAGECELQRYTLKTAPPEILLSLQREGEQYCETCKAHYRIATEVKTVAYAYIRSPEEDD